MDWIKTYFKLVELCWHFFFKKEQQKKQQNFPEVNKLPASQDDFQLLRQLMEKYFNPLRSHRDNPTVKGPKLESVDHHDKKLRKIAPAKSQQMKHQHPNQGHRHQNSHQGFHHSDDNSHE